MTFWDLFYEKEFLALIMAVEDGGPIYRFRNFSSRLTTKVSPI